MVNVYKKKKKKHGKAYVPFAPLSNAYVSM